MLAAGCVLIGVASGEDDGYAGYGDRGARRNDRRRQRARPFPESLTWRDHTADILGLREDPDCGCQAARSFGQGPSAFFFFFFVGNACACVLRALGLCRAKDSREPSGWKARAMFCSLGGVARHAN